MADLEATPEGSNEARQELSWTSFDEYNTYLFEKSRPPSRGGNTGALHTHFIKIGGETYSFFAVGAKKWAFKGDQIRFSFVIKDGKYRNADRESIEVRDKGGNPVVRGDRSHKSKLRTADTRLPARRSEWKD